MRLGLAAILSVALGTNTVLADYATIYTACPYSTCYSEMVWVDGFEASSGSYDGQGGCRDDPGPPGIQTLCLDDANLRGHYYYKANPDGKRCLKRAWAWDVA